MSDDECHEEAGTSGPDGSVARAMEKCRNGDASELGSMVFAFHSLLLEKARAKLRKAPNLQSITDDEGAVSSAMESYWRAVQDGKYRDMKHTNELLGLLITIVERKVARQIRRYSSGKAGGGKVINEPETGLEAGGREPSPVEAAMERESFVQMEVVIGRWHEYMTEKGLLDVAELVLEGRGYRAIAEKLKIREAKARRLITTVNTLTGAFGKEEDSES